MSREIVVPVDSETFNKLKSVCVRKNVISSRSRAVRVHKTSGFAVFSAPLVGVGSHIKPGFVVELFGQRLYFVRVRIQITEDEGRPVRVLCFFMQYGLDYSVGFLGDFGVLRTSGIAISVVGSWIQQMFDVKVGHV